MQATSNNTNAPLCRYWAWRFDRTIHAGGHSRVFLDGQVQFIKDSRTPF